MSHLYTIKHGKGFTRTGDPYRTNLDIVNKDTLLHVAKMLDVKGIYKSHSKEKMTEAISVHVLAHPQESLSSLSSKELLLLKDLVLAGSNTHVSRPSRKYYDTLKQLLFVSVYHDKKERRLYFVMPDDLRECFAPFLDKLLKEAKKREQSEKEVKPTVPATRVEEPVFLDDDDDYSDDQEPLDPNDELLQHLKAAFPMIDFDEIYGLTNDDDDEEDDEEPEEDGPGHFSYSCSVPMMEDIRSLSYTAQAEVCKAFHKFVRKGFPGDDSYLIDRFEESYSEIVFSHLDGSLDQIHYTINDLDSAIHEIDMFNPMTFFDLERKLAPVIRRGPKKGEDSSR